MKLTRLVICFPLALITAVASAQTDTTFTYQGELNENGTPVNGAYAMAFILFDDVVGGIVVGTPVFAVISIKAIQELDSKVDQLEAENDELHKRLGSLEQLVEQLALTQQENTK